MVGSQYFPLYIYDRVDDAVSVDGDQYHLFVANAKTKPKKSNTVKRHGITDEGLKHFRTAYPTEEISKDDIFYYVYGILHSADYRERYADNLGKELPRMPRVRTAADFWAFSRAGRALGDLHVGYDDVAEYRARVEVSVTTPQGEALPR